MRLLSLAPSMTEIIYALSKGSDLISATTFCDYPDPARFLPKVGGWTTGHDYKAIERLHPDLIFTCMYIPPGIEELCKRLRIQWIHVDPHTLDGVLESIVTVGEALGVKNGACAIVQTMQEKFAKLRAHQPKAKPRIYCEEWHTPPMVAGNWVPEIIDIAGGISLAPSGKPSYAVSAEDIQRFDPDFIIAHWCGFGPHSRMHSLAARQGWENLRAIQQHAFVAMDDALLNRPGPRLIEGASALQMTITGQD